MSDLLLALARRALQPPAIRPRIGSRFENDAIVQREFEQAPQAQLASTRELPKAPAAIPVAVQSRPESSTPMTTLLPVTPMLQRVASLLQPTSPAGTLPPAMPGPPQTLVSAVFESPKESGLPRDPLLLSPVDDTAPQHSPPGPQTRLIERFHSERRIEHHELSRELIERRVERLHEQAPGSATVSPSLHARQEPHPAQADGQAAAPRIEINIGRIEILPHEAAPASRVEQPPRRLPAKSLDDYLSERNSGAGPRS
ncbi:hypothetical protein AN403_2210 [Pseudomonas fluorescens]|uniref:Uncharacterized protein n=1 Tax=Pseudomonas fluorescens TaxID=294 RepID=A0A0N8NVT8_PSEFL|nr:hypothetical protein [Pseudomonas fluorescens]KPU55521.1 hypothetical protein AN403_2210 [Pseudomonas fluorescens]